VTAGGDPVVEFRDVSRVFGNIAALTGASWTVGRGDVLGLLGHNGAGKTTALRLTSGVLTATAGRVRVFGLDPATRGAQVRRHTGVMLANPAVDRRLTGRENLWFAGRMHGLDRDDARARIDELAVSFHLDDRLDERVERYSDGMRQRLALARMLLPNPTLLLLDEPTATLDPMAAHGVRQLIRDLVAAHARTVVLATHDLIEAAELCDRVAVLQHGSVVASGPPDRLARRVSARGLRVIVDAASAGTVSDVALAHGYTTEPVDTGVLRVHGVDYEAVPVLVRQLVEAGADLYGVAVDQPTLTDFYLALHRDGLAAADDAGLTA
jgi:ABC-type multidrug transport system ATPase subunit